MANYIGTARSNYFHVKDTEKFSEFCDRIDVEMISKPDGRVGFLCTQDDTGSLQRWAEDEDGETIDVDLCAELAPHLKDGEVAVMMESGYEKFRYVTGYAMAVNSKGETRQVDLGDIYKLAKEIGNAPTPCEY